MQDIHAIGVGGSGSGRLFAGGGGGGGGDRRLRPGQHGGVQNHQQQALRCPRCDSLNTKFCYYNNYNLSQPRHFCKSCRRYWTKGGVLRNVPVGGGCRKTKRSKSKQASASASVAFPSAEVPAERSSNNSHSSSESSSLTATTTAAKKTPPVAVSSGEVASASISAGDFPNFGDSRFFLSRMDGNGNTFDQPQPLIDPIGTSEGQMFTDMGSFSSLMSSSNDPGMLSFNPKMADISGFGLQQQEQGSVADDQNQNQNNNQLVGGSELKMEQQINCDGYLDQTGNIGFPGLLQNRTGNDGLPGLDWQMNDGEGIGGGDDGGGGGDQGLFDFSGAVDQTYWDQNQWSDLDQSFNFPPLI